MSTEVEVPIWFVLNAKGERISTIVKADYDSALIEAERLFGAGIQVIDSGETKKKCCNKCKDTPCGEDV